jgi:hypothetical protein
MEGLQQLLGILSVQCPTRLVFSFHLCKIQRSDKHYGPDDATLWPQPWVEMFCHLGAIPRKLDDPNDNLSIMWWDSTPDDFQFFGSSTIPSADHCKMFCPEHSWASA